jgi:hypothetical protein
MVGEQKIFFHTGPTAFLLAAALIALDGDIRQTQSHRPSFRTIVTVSFRLVLE